MGKNSKKIKLECKCPYCGKFLVKEGEFIKCEYCGFKIHEFWFDDFLCAFIVEG